MPMLRTIERPTKATLRPCSCAASSTCWMRCTWLAKLDTMIRRGAVRNTSSMAGARSRSEVVKPGTSALVESTRKRSTPSSPSRANARRSVMRLVERELVHLEVAGVQHQPGLGADGDREAVRDGVVDRDELEVEHPELAALPLGDLDGDRGDLVLLELRGEERQRQLRADHGDVGPLAQQVRHAADVVLVAVREDDRLDLVEPVPDPGEVRQDHVDPGLVLLGEEHPAVDDEQLAVVLEDRHVAADLAEAAERDDAQGALRQRRWRT